MSHYLNLSSYLYNNHPYTGDVHLLSDNFKYRLITDNIGNDVPVISKDIWNVKEPSSDTLPIYYLGDNLDDLHRFLCREKGYVCHQTDEALTPWHHCSQESLYRIDRHYAYQNGSSHVEIHIVRSIPFIVTDTILIGLDYSILANKHGAQVLCCK